MQYQASSTETFDILSAFKQQEKTRGGGLAQWLASRTTDQGVPGSRLVLVAVRCGLVVGARDRVLYKPLRPVMQTSLKHRHLTF